MRTAVALVVALGASITAVACGGSPSGPSQSGNLRLMITDSPFSEATALHVTFSEVKVHRADEAGGWITVPFGPGEPAPTERTCNLKKLEDATDILGVASLDVGHYTQLRLVVKSATIYFGGDPAAEACATTLAAPTSDPTKIQQVEIPSGEVKLVHEFELMSSGVTTIELDFDGDRSVHQTGNGRYMMSPVIRILKVNAVAGGG